MVSFYLHPKIGIGAPKAEIIFTGEGRKALENPLLP